MSCLLPCANLVGRWQHRLLAWSLGSFAFMVSQVNCCTQPISATESNVVIADQILSKTNLASVLFANGDTIQQASSEAEWHYCVANMIPAWCDANNDITSVSVYGLLCNYFAATDKRGLAPRGWKVADAKDWCKLLWNLDSMNARRIARSPQSKSGWDHSGIDKFGIAAKPSGARSSNGGCCGKGIYCAWWNLGGDAAGACNTELYYRVWGQELIELNGAINVGYVYDWRTTGPSVRCVKNESKVE